MNNHLLQDDLLNKTLPLKMRWAMIGFALVATTLNYIHRLSFNYLAANGYLRDIIPDDTFGYIATSFFIAYLISNAVSGFVIDKFSAFTVTYSKMVTLSFSI